MWPSFFNNGAELTYGINSNAYIATDSTSAGGSVNFDDRYNDTKQKHHSYSLNYANESDAPSNGSCLFEVLNSYVILDNPMAGDKIPPSFFEKNNDIIPYSLMCDDTNIDPSTSKSYPKQYHDLNKESSLWQSHYIHDPLVSKLLLCETFNDKYKILVYSRGIQNDSFIKISSIRLDKTLSLLPDEKQFDMKSKEINIKDFTVNPLETINVGSPIKGLTFSQDIYIKDSINIRYLAVRTSLSILIYKVICISYRNFSVELLDQIPGVFSDVSFNYWDKSQFATITTDNVWKIWSIKNEKIYIPKNENDDVLQGTLQLSNFSDLSKWRKIIWGNTMDDLIIFTRSSIYFLKLYGINDQVSHVIKKFNLTHNSIFSENKEVDGDYDEKSSPKNRHIEIVNSNLDELFILTSHELIWAKIETNALKKVNKLRKIISWKHFLDPDDPSLRFSLNSVASTNYKSDYNQDDREYIILISSDVYPAYITIRFRFDAKDGLYYIVGGAPSILEMDRISEIDGKFSEVQTSILLDLNPIDIKRKRKSRLVEAGTDISDTSMIVGDGITTQKANRRKLNSPLSVKEKKMKIYKSDEFVTEKEENDSESKERGTSVSQLKDKTNGSQGKQMADLFDYHEFDHKYYSVLRIRRDGILVKTIISNDFQTINIRQKDVTISKIAATKKKLIDRMIQDDLDAIKYAIQLEDNSFRIRDIFNSKIMKNDSKEVDANVIDLYSKVFQKEHENIKKKGKTRISVPEVNPDTLSELSEDLDISEDAFLIVSDWNIKSVVEGDNINYEDMNRSQEWKSGTIPIALGTIHEDAKTASQRSIPDSTPSKRSHSLMSQSGSQAGAMPTSSSLSNCKKKKKKKKKSGFA